MTIIVMVMIEELLVILMFRTEGLFEYDNYGDDNNHNKNRGDGNDDVVTATILLSTRKSCQPS